MEPNRIATEETPNLIAADKVEGTAVYNREAQNIGVIKTVMLNKLNGRIAYAVLESGGFLGIGADYYPVPWEALKYNTQLGGYVVAISGFDDAPRYPAESEPNWTDRVFGERLRRHYGLPDAAAL